MKKIIFLFTALIAFGSANAQISATASNTVTVTIPETAVIQVSGGNAQLTYVNVPQSVGGPLTDISISGVNLQYTSITKSVANGGKERTIYVTTTSVTPSTTKGVSLNVKATMPLTGFMGDIGDAVVNGADIMLSSNANAPVWLTSLTKTGSTPKIVEGITSGYTGTAGTNGPSLTYYAKMSTVLSAEFATLRADSYVFVVAYTLTDTL